jgi:glycosyltransferase 2 family protein
VLLYYSLRGIDWRAVGATIGGADLGLLVLCAAIASGTLLLRAWRWRILLNAEADVPVSTAFWATAAGLFANNFLPARAGELVRTYMISARGLPLPYVLATALAERIVDAVVLLVICSLVLIGLPSPPGWFATAATPFAAIGLAGAAAIAVLPFLGSTGRAVIQRLPIAAALKPRVSEAMDHGLRGMRAFHHPLRLGAFLALALVIWCVDAAGTVIGGAALGLSIPPAAALLLIAGLSLGSALPATPGYIGIYQFVAVSVLTPFGIVRGDAIAYILVAQALMYAVVAVWGSVGLAKYRRGAVQREGSNRDLV